MSVGNISNDSIPIDILGDYLEPSLDLLKFYRSKLAAFDSERSEYIGRLADVDAQNSEVHRLRWELRAREDEIEELQKAVGDAKLFLYDEREQVLKLQAENDDLKSQEIRDRQRIQELLALTEPVAHEVSGNQGNRWCGHPSYRKCCEFRPSFT
jgi:coiled-coil domain-containing protein 77